MEREELEVLIPSEAVRSYVLETGWTFTDKEKAALLCHPSRPWEEELSLLLALSERTDDEELREQITAYLNHEEQAIQTFKKNTGRQSVYVLKVEREASDKTEICGYFFDWERAFEIGKTEKAPFVIEKYRIGDVDVFDDGTCCHHITGEIRFNKDGAVRIVSSCEIPSLDETNQHFSEMYFEVPNPFVRGDLVKTRWGSYGIVGMTQEDWKESVEKHKRMLQNGSFCTDYSDVIIGVDIFDEETGFFCPTDSISPLDLERYQPKDDWCGGTMDTLLLRASSIYRNNGYISDLFYWLEKYQQASGK